MMAPISSRQVEVPIAGSEDVGIRHVGSFLQQRVSGFWSRLLRGDKRPYAMEEMMSAMLLGSVVFVMAIFYLVNHPHKDMRRYTWKVISATVSIFISLNMYAAIAGLLDELLIDGYNLSNEYKIALGFLEQWFYLIVLFLVLRRTAEIGRNTSKRKVSRVQGRLRMSKLEQKQQKMSKKEKDNVEHNIIFVGSFFSHTAAFSVLHTFSVLQQLCKDSVLQVFLIPVTVFVYTAIIFYLFDKLREYVQRNREDRYHDELNEIWTDVAEESQDDISALAISFLLSQAMCRLICGYLPDPAGHLHMTPTMNQLTALTLITITLALLIIISQKVIGEGKSVFKLNLSEARKKDVGFAIHVFSMTFAWLVFFNASSYIRMLSLSMEILTLLVTALVITVVAFLIISVLDKFEHKAEEEAVKDIKSGKLDAGLIMKDNMQGLTKIIFSIGILIGFAWKRVFDEAIKNVDDLTNNISKTAFADLLMSCVLVAIVAPAWRFYVIPTVETMDEDFLQELNSDLGGYDKIEKKQQVFHA